MDSDEKNNRNWESYILIPTLIPLEILGNVIRVFVVTPLYKIIIGAFIFGIPAMIIWGLCAFVIVNGCWFSQNWNWTRPISFVLTFPFLILGAVINFSMYTEDEHRKYERTKMLMYFPFYDTPASDPTGE